LNTAAKNPELVKKVLSQKDANTPEHPFFTFFTSFEREVRRAVRQKIIRPIDPLELFLAVFSLNLFPSLIWPVLQVSGILTEEQYRQLMRRRRRRVTAFISDAIIRHPEQTSNPK
jgi:hypothetical protein